MTLKCDYNNIEDQKKLIQIASRINSCVVNQPLSDSKADYLLRRAEQLTRAAEHLTKTADHLKNVEKHLTKCADALSSLVDVYDTMLCNLPVSSYTRKFVNESRRYR